MKAAGFASACISISIIVQALLFITFGALADFGAWRYNLLVATTAVGSVVTMLMVFLGDASYYWLGGWMMIASNVAYGGCCCGCL